VGPETGLGDMNKRKILPVPGLELRPLSHPGRNQSLYRLRYPGSCIRIKEETFLFVKGGIQTQLL
jgi:hypothetical protein